MEEHLDLVHKVELAGGSQTEEERRAGNLEEDLKK